MYLNLSVLTVGTVLSFVHNKTFVGNGGAGMKALSLGDSFRKTEGRFKSFFSKGRKEQVKGFPTTLDKCSEHWAALNLSHLSGFIYPTLFLLDNKCE